MVSLGDRNLRFRATFEEYPDGTIHISGLAVIPKELLKLEGIEVNYENRKVGTVIDTYTEGNNVIAIVDLSDDDIINKLTKGGE